MQQQTEMIQGREGSDTEEPPNDMTGDRLGSLQQGLFGAEGSMEVPAPSGAAKPHTVRAALVDRWVSPTGALLVVKNQEEQLEVVRAIGVNKPTSGMWQLIVKGASKAKEFKVPMEDAELAKGRVHMAALGFFGAPIGMGLSYIQVKAFGSEVDEVAIEVLVDGEPVGGVSAASLVRILEEGKWYQAPSWAPELGRWNGEARGQQGAAGKSSEREPEGYWAAEFDKRREASSAAQAKGYDDSRDDYEVDLAGYFLMLLALVKSGVLAEGEVSVHFGKVAVPVSAMTRTCCCNAEDLHRELREAEERLEKGLGSPSMKLLDDTVKHGALHGASTEQKGNAVRPSAGAGRQVAAEGERAGAASG